MKRRGERGDFVDLFGALRRRLQLVATEAYAAAGMARIQARLLRHVAEHGGISQAELARATDTDPALAGRTLQALIDDGLVRRERSREDHRQYVLELTAAGRRARERVERARAELSKRIARVLDERDLADFERIVDKVVSAFDGH